MLSKFWSLSSRSAERRESVSAGLQEIAAAIGTMSMLRASVVAKRFQEKVAKYWTPERIKHATGGRDMPLALDQPGVPTLLRVLGVLDGEGKLTNINKYKYTNHLRYNLG